MATRSRKCEDTETRPSRSWSDLPEDILILILKPLYLVDRIRFGAVCKGWHLPFNHRLQPIDKLPWTMEYRWKETTDSNLTLSMCKVYEPLHHDRKLPYIIDDGLIEGRTDFVDAEALASKYSWVLFSKRKEREAATVLFFFNPFTKEVISLPPNLESGEFKLVAAFSSPPTSPGCVVFVASPPILGKISISTYNCCGGEDKKDKTWNTRIFEGVNELSQAVESVAYMDGAFYCHLGLFQVASFNIANQEWSFVRAYSGRFTDLIHDKGMRCNYMLECDGELLLIYENKKVIARDDDRVSGLVFRLNWLEKKWVDTYSLKDGAIFLGETSFWVSDGGETEIISNSIYCDAKFDPTYDSETDKEVGIWHSYKIKGGCGLKSVWIQPPLEF